MAKLRGEAKEAWERTVRLHRLLRSGGAPDAVISWLIGGTQALETPQFAMFEAG